MFSPAFNNVPDYYVIGKDCYFETGNPVNGEPWQYFKNLENIVLRESLKNKDVAISIDLIDSCWNVVRHMALNHIMRNACYQFEEYCKSNNIMCSYDLQTDMYYLKWKSQLNVEDYLRVLPEIKIKKLKP